MRAAGPAAARGRRGRAARGARGASGGKAQEDLEEERDEGGVRKREEVRVWLDLRAIIICTNLKHWKVSLKKSCGRWICFLRAVASLARGAWPAGIVAQRAEPGPIRPGTIRPGTISPDN